MSANEVYYFAYGSNLCQERLKKSIQNLRFKCSASLEVCFEHFKHAPGTNSYKMSC